MGFSRQHFQVYLYMYHLKKLIMDPSDNKPVLGPLFTKRAGVLPQDLAKFRSREIRVYNFPITSLPRCPSNCRLRPKYEIRTWRRRRRPPRRRRRPRRWWWWWWWIWFIFIKNGFLKGGFYHSLQGFFLPWYSISLQLYNVPVFFHIMFRNQPSV